MLFTSLLAFAGAAAVSASPVAQVKSAVLPLTKNHNVTSVKNIVDKGQARLNKVNGIATSGKRATAVSSGAVTNDVVSYVAPVVIGGATYSLIVDTGCKLLVQSALETLTNDFTQPPTPGAVLSLLARSPQLV